MSKFPSFEPNVQDFVNSCSDLVGAFHHDRFSQNHAWFCGDNEITSPIEQILYYAMEALREMNYIEDGDVHEVCGKPMHLGLKIRPQHHIGKFRVDFLVTYGTRVGSKSVVVECDSQKFHDRDEKERRYEKMRDRFLQASGFTVFRFTGSEICRQPYRVASEILGFLVDQDPTSLLDFPSSVGAE